jgi:ATP-binding cassette, subfamily B (MDR/TAP), member 1
MGRIMSFYSPLWLGLFGIVVSIVNAFGFPIYGMIYAKLLFVLMVPFRPDYQEERDYWCGMFLLLVFMIGIVGFLQKYIFMYIGENLTYTVRNQLYTGIIYKNIAWFDSKDKAPGILSSVLSEDIGALNGLTTEHLAILIEAALGLIIGMIIALFYTWKMGLITLGMVPFVFLGGVMMSRLAWKVKPGNKTEKQKEDDPYNKSNALLSDIIMNYRTVIGFGEKNFEYLLSKFDNLLEEPNRVSVRASHIAGFYFGYGQAVRFVFVGIVFYIAAVMIAEYGDDQSNTYIGVNTLFVAALGSGISISSAPSVGKAKEAAKKIFGIVDEKSKIDTREEKGKKEIERGEIEFVHTDFKYPSRTSKVLN